MFSFCYANVFQNIFGKPKSTSDIGFIFALLCRMCVCVGMFTSLCMLGAKALTFEIAVTLSVHLFYDWPLLDGVLIFFRLSHELLSLSSFLLFLCLLLLLYASPIPNQFQNDQTTIMKRPTTIPTWSNSNPQPMSTQFPRQSHDYFQTSCRKYVAASACMFFGQGVIVPVNIC